MGIPVDKICICSTFFLSRELDLDLDFKCDRNVNICRNSFLADLA